MWVRVPLPSPKINLDTRILFWYTNFMSYENKYPDWEDKVKEASRKSVSAREAAKYLNINYDTYKKYATKYGCFKTNQAGIGIDRSRTNPLSTFDIWDILEGLHPQYQSNKLRIRLIDEGIFEEKCQKCGIKEWNNKPAPLELNDIDGNPRNHRLNNIEIICPNCHAQIVMHKQIIIGVKI